MASKSAIATKAIAIERRPNQPVTNAIDIAAKMTAIIGHPPEDSNPQLSVAERRL